jgi:hypothetical protein
MSWTDEAKVEFMLRLPWTIVPDVSPEGDSLLRVTELPSAVASGNTPEKLEDDFWESLRSTLNAYVLHGEDPPLPTRVKALPWHLGRKLADVPTFGGAPVASLPRLVAA